MKFCIIGSAHAHLFGFIEQMLAMGGDLIGVYDNGDEFVSKVVEQYKVPVVKDIEELFRMGPEICGCFAVNNQKIDIVELCETHAVPIMCDKPLVTDAAGLARLEAVMSRRRIEIGLLLPMRFMPSVYKLKQLIDEGEIGKLINMEIFNPHRLAPLTRPAWHFNRNQGGGISIDLFAHSLDIFTWFTNETICRTNSTVTKSILPEKEEFFDLATTSVLTPSGVSGYLRVDWHIPTTHFTWGDARIFCMGTTGYAEARCVCDPITKQEMLIVFSQKNGTQLIECPPVNLDETSDFIARIHGEAHSITQEDILNVCKKSLEIDEKATYIVL